MPENRFTLPSFAKINLDLRVIGKRADGFHDICTIFQTVDLADSILFEAADELSLSVSDETVPAGGSNLILRAAESLRRGLGSKAGARMHLEKNIPSPGGLGGGSSNAATALIGLSRLWGLKPDRDLLHRLAAELGSDVPFFLIGGTAAGTGRGTDLEPLPDIECGPLIIVAPHIDVPTREAFEGLGARGLTKEESGRILLNYRFWAGTTDLCSADLKNDFEKTVFAAHPEIGEAKRRLVELGARHAALSGSGASVFGIFDKEETRQTALKALGTVTNWRSFAVATVTREKYRGALGIVP